MGTIVQFFSTVAVGTEEGLECGDEHNYYRTNAGLKKELFVLNLHLNDANEMRII